MVGPWYGAFILNTATYSHISDSGSASAGFSIIGNTTLYLPIIIK